MRSGGGRGGWGKGRFLERFLNVLPVARNDVSNTGECSARWRGRGYGAAPGPWDLRVPLWDGPRPGSSPVTPYCRTLHSFTACTCRQLQELSYCIYFHDQDVLLGLELCFDVFRTTSILSLSVCTQDSSFIVRCWIILSKWLSWFPYLALDTKIIVYRFLAPWHSVIKVSDGSNCSLCFYLSVGEGVRRKWSWTPMSLNYIDICLRVIRNSCTKTLPSDHGEWLLERLVRNTMGE